MVGESGEPPLVGREREQRRISDAVAQRIPVLITGPIGIGKSRLLRWYVSTVAGGADRVRRVVGIEAISEIPLAAFASTPTDARPLTPWVVARELRTSMPADGATLIVDDAHWLDPTSLAVIAELATGRDIAIVVATRPPAHHIAEMLTTASGVRTPTIELGALPPDAGAAVAKLTARRPLDAERRALIHTRAGGNPLFIEQLVASIEERGDGSDTARLEGTATGAIAARLGNLGSDERTLLQLVAVAGSIPIAVLERFGDAATLERLERRGLVHVGSDGHRTTVTTAHPLIGEAVAASMSLATRRRSVADLADTISASPMRRRDDVATLAVLSTRAGRAIDPDLATAAARSLVTRGGSELACRLARDAYERDPTLERAQLLAWCLLYLGQAHEARAVLANATALTSTSAERAALATDRMLLALHGLHDPVEAEQALEIDTDGLDEPDRQLLRAHGAGPALYRGNVGECIERFDAADAFFGTGHPASFWAALPAVIGLTVAGRAGEAVTVAERLRPHVNRFATLFPTVAATLDSEQATAATWFGDQRRALKLINDAITGAHAESNAPALELLSIIAPLVRWVGGDLTGAGPLARDGAHLRGAYAIWVPYTALHLAAAAYRCGDTATGGAMDALARRIAIPAMDLCRPVEARAAGERAWATGDLPTAYGLWREGIAIAGEQGNVVEAYLCAARVASTSPGPAEIAVARAAAERLVGPLGGSLVRCWDELDARGPGTAVAQLLRDGYAVLALDVVDAAVLVTPAWELGPRIVHSTRSLRGGVTRPPPVRDDLTPREREVASLVSAGLTDAMIARELGVSVRTVNAHVRSILAKLGHASRRALHDSPPTHA